MSMRTFLLICLMLGMVIPASAQLVPAGVNDTRDRLLRQPKPYKVLSVSVDGVSDETTRFLVIRQSGLNVGDEVIIPGGEMFSKAIQRLYRLGIFSDVEILTEKEVDDGVFLLIRVKEEAKLGSYEFSNISGGDRDDLRKQVPLLRGQAVKPGDIDRTRRIIQKFYEEKGFPLSTVEVTTTETEDNRINLTFKLDKGKRVEIEKVVVHGNEAFSDGKVGGRMKDTKADRWWRFWSRATFKSDKFEEDKENIVAFYNEKGYYDARVVDDSTYIVGADTDHPYRVVEVTVHEGSQYHIRNISWEGNTEYTDEALTEALGFLPGDVYNSKKLEENLYANARSADVSSLYYNRGYVRFGAFPTVHVENDSLDLNFQIQEGDIYTFGDINIQGNTKTKEHVVRRMLRTLPGYTFSREAIQRSLRELSQLGYFNPESMIPETQINPETKTVDVSYQLEETGGDQLEFSGGWGGFGGLLLQVGVTFRNFSIHNFFNKDAWRPLPSGDGQTLSLGVQVQGRFYQNYSASFQEPWFRGKPHPVGFSLSHSRYNLNQQFNQFLGTVTTLDDNPDNELSITSAQVSYGRQLKVPDDYFSIGSSLGWRIYNFGTRSEAYGLPPGKNQALTITQRLSRNSLDNPMFPSSGSSVLLSLEVAPPLPGFLQYHKWQLESNWNLPIFRKLSFGIGANYGYVGSLTGDEVSFERFLVGGTPFDAQGGRFGFGRDLIYQRGYPAASITPLNPNGSLRGGTILNKYTSELRVIAVQSPQFSLQPYWFLDAVNTWDGLINYNPANLYRSTGFGVRVFLPILGMLNLNYGYNFDKFRPTNGESGDPSWRFQFSIGQSF